MCEGRHYYINTAMNTACAGKGIHNGIVTICTIILCSYSDSDSHHHGRGHDPLQLLHASILRLLYLYQHELRQ